MLLHLGVALLRLLLYHIALLRLLHNGLNLNSLLRVKHLSNRGAHLLASYRRNSSVVKTDVTINGGEYQFMSEESSVDLPACSILYQRNI